MTFARLAKLLAVLLVAAALWRAREPSAPARVVVLALPGAAMDILAAGGGRLHPAEIRIPEATAGVTFWRRLLAAADDGTRDPMDLPSLWSGETAAMRSLAVPARLFGDADRAAEVEGAFLGGSSGTVVDADDITSGRLPVPYDRAIDEVVASAATLKRDEWSEWLSVRGSAGKPADDASPSAEFQFARLTDTTYFFSPAYADRDLNAVSSPFLRGLDREMRTLVAAHVLGLAARRLAPSGDLFRSASDTRPVVVFDSVAEDVGAVFAPDSTPSALLEQARVAVAARIATLRAAVGAGGLVLIFGGPSTTRQDAGVPWYAIVEGGDSTLPDESGTSSPLDFDAARVLIRYVAGVSLDERDKALLPVDVARRYPVRARVASAATPASAPAPGREWSTTAIESVRGAIGGGD